MLWPYGNITSLIIDEVGYCDSLSESESNILFQILDRRYDKRKGSNIFTSNLKTSDSRTLFFDSSIAKCALDIIMDECIAIEILSASYRW